MSESIKFERLSNDFDIIDLNINRDEFFRGFYGSFFRGNKGVDDGFFVALDACGNMLGYSYFKKDFSNGVLKIEDIKTRESCSGQKIGSRILSRVCEEGAYLGLKNISFTPVVSAIGFYEDKLGFDIKSDEYGQKYCFSNIRKAREKIDYYVSKNNKTVEVSLLCKKGKDKETSLQLAS